MLVGLVIVVWWLVWCVILVGLVLRFGVYSMISIARLVGLWRDLFCKCGLMCFNCVVCFWLGVCDFVCCLRGCLTSLFVCFEVCLLMHVVADC